MQQENRFRFECPECDKKFRQRNKMEMHRVTHLDSATKPYKCLICGKGFRFRDYLGVHQRLHENPNSSKHYQCKFCKQTFHSIHQRSVHQQTVHFSEYCDTDSNLICPVALCGKQFFVKCKLLAHLKRHSDRRDYKCDVCQRCFFERAHLKSHQMIHQLIRPFQCELCQASFQRKFNLDQHRKIHLKSKAKEKDSEENS